MTRKANNDRAKIHAANNGTNCQKQICNYYYSILFTFIIATVCRSSHSCGLCIFCFSLRVRLLRFSSSTHFFLLLLACEKLGAQTIERNAIQHDLDGIVSRRFRLYSGAAAFVVVFACRSIKPINHRCCDTPNNA